MSYSASEMTEAMTRHGVDPAVTPLAEQLAVAYIILRETYFATRDKVDAMMHTETELKHQLEQNEQIVNSLESMIDSLEALGRDASSYRTEQEQAAAAASVASVKLNVVRQKLAYTRALMKDLDLAHDGLHWARFDEERLCSYCRDHP